MQTLFVIDLALLGLAVGSFLNVVIARLPTGDSIVTPRSHCPKCGYVLRWYENIPVVSWVALRGRCSSCKLPISARYVLVELLTGTLFLAALVRFGWTWELVLGLTFVTLIVPLVFIDAEHWVLPFELTLPGITLGLLLQLPRGWPAVRDAVIGAAAAFLFFRFMEAAGWFFARKEALGAGDKFLMAMVGAFMGWKVLLGVVLLSSLQGALFGIIRIALTGRAAPELPGGSDAESGTPAGESPAAQATSGATSAPGAAPAVGTPPQPATTAGADATQPGTAQPAPTSAAPDASAGAAPDAPAGVPSSGDGSAQDASGEGTGDDDAPLVFTPDFLRPGLSLARRLVLVPWTLFLQPIPDEPPASEGDEDTEWVPGPTNMPFGPWIGLSALQVLLLGPWLSQHLGSGLLGTMMRLVFAS